MPPIDSFELVVCCVGAAGGHGERAGGQPLWGWFLPAALYPALYVLHVHAPHGWSFPVYCNAC